MEYKLTVIRKFLCSPKHSFLHFSALIAFLLTPADVTLIYEIIGRPDEARPITGETVTFTCEVEGGAVVWETDPPAAISNGQVTLVPAVNPIGEPTMDVASGEHLYACSRVFKYGKPPWGEEGSCSRVWQATKGGGGGGGKEGKERKRSRIAGGRVGVGKEEAHLMSCSLSGFDMTVQLHA